MRVDYNNNLNIIIIFITINNNNNNNNNNKDEDVLKMMIPEWYHQTTRSGHASSSYSCHSACSRYLFLSDIHIYIHIYMSECKYFDYTFLLSYIYINII